MKTAVKRAIIQLLIYDDSKSCAGKWITGSFLIRGHFYQETSIPMHPIELTDSLGADPTHFKWKNSLSAKVFDLTVSAAFITVLVLPIKYKFGTIVK